MNLNVHLPNYLSVHLTIMLQPAYGSFTKPWPLAMRTYVCTDVVIDYATLCKYDNRNGDLFV